jgi:hypothetical protein
VGAAKQVELTVTVHEEDAMDTVRILHRREAGFG